MALDLEALGMTQVDLQDRVVDAICSRLLGGKSIDDNGDEYGVKSGLQRKLDTEIAKRIDAAVDALADKHVLPNVIGYVEKLSLQKTNAYGEKKGEPVSFIEYLIAKANDYLTETVNYDGKGKDSGVYGWKGTSTRVVHLIEKHLHYSIERAMKEAVGNANKTITEGIEKAVKIKLSEIGESLAVSVKTK